MTASRGVRFGAVVVVAVAYAAVFRTGEARIAAQRAQNAELAERVRTEAALLATRAALERERAVDMRARRALPSADAAAAFMRDAAAIAAAHGTTIGSIVAAARRDPGASGLTARGLAAPAPPGDAAFDVVVDGRYPAILATIRALGAGRVPAGIEVASIARKSADADDPSVSASMRVHLGPESDAR